MKPQLDSSRRAISLLTCLLGWLSLVEAGFGQPVAALREPIGESNGSLVLVGGETLPDAVRDRFIQLAGGKQAKLVLMPTASDSAGEKSLESWKKLELASVVMLHASKRTQADDVAFVKPTTEATGVWLIGGDPAKLATAYRGTLVEKELKKLLDRGGVIGGNGALLSNVAVAGDKAGEGLGLLPGVIIDPQFLKLEPKSLAKYPGYFGIGIDDQSAVVIKGRHVTVIGKSPAVICQNAGEKKAASARTLKSGEVADLIALSRSAIARSQPAFPPEKMDPPNVAKGSLLIGGGGSMSDDIWKRFIELAGGPDAPIVFVPTALQDPLPAVAGEVKALKKNGAKNITVLHTRHRAEADKPEFAAPLKEAKGVWFSGGRQWRFVDAYEGTVIEKAFHDVLQRGGVIGGSSAGASIQSEYMPRGDPLGNLNIIAEGYERGFGFLKGVAVDQHFFVRKREKDMSELIKTYPQLLGIGLDEGTVIIVHGPVLEVVGKSKIGVYDHRKPAVDGKDYEELPAGAKYDMEKRQRIGDK